MSAENENKRSFYEKLRDNYRLVVIDEEDLKEVNSFNFNLLSLYMLLSTAVVLLGAMIIGLLFFTPLKKMVPGYGDITMNDQFIELTSKVDDLEEIISAQEVYNNGLRKLLSGIDTIGEQIEPVALSTPQKLADGDIREQARTKELNQLVFARPLAGTISANYDPGIRHMGIDVIAPKNTAIKSILEGIVVNADWSVEGGNTVTVQHPRNIVSIYKHNSALLVKAGDIVKTGQAVAIIGNTGKLTSGPHLHFELWYDGSPLNPSNYISFN